MFITQHHNVFRRSLIALPVFFDTESTMETLPDTDSSSTSGGSMDDAAIDALLGEDTGLTPGVLPNLNPAQTQETPAPAPQTTQPQTSPTQPQQPPAQVPTQDPAVSAAFAEQRRYFEAQAKASEQQTNALMAALQRLAPPQPTPQAPKMPDPVDEPEKFAAWVEQRAEERALARLAPVVQPLQQNTQQLQQAQAVRAYEDSLNAAKAKYGEAQWQEVFNAAGEFAKQFPGVVQNVFASQNPGEALAALGARSIGKTLTPVQGSQAQVPGTQLSEEQIRADERARVAREFMNQQQQNPYSRAVPSITSLPSQPVAANGGKPIAPGSKEEEDLLGS